MNAAQRNVVGVDMGMLLGQLEISSRFGNIAKAKPSAAKLLKGSSFRSLWANYLKLL